MNGRWRFLADAGAMLGLSAAWLAGLLEPLEAAALLSLTLVAAPPLLLSGRARPR